MDIEVAEILKKNISVKRNKKTIKYWRDERKVYTKWASGYHIQSAWKSYYEELHEVSLRQTWL